ncbi:hypothetical protein [Gorillibacterium sp. sgz5001074]|uniref:hypothetical protein n=1 Tax=Gorillibacterium sp. sgz5001074 TaxID=3446695 RepID=UPI003F66B452
MDNHADERHGSWPEPENGEVWEALLQDFGSQYDRLMHRMSEEREQNARLSARLAELQEQENRAEPRSAIREWNVRRAEEAVMTLQRLHEEDLRMLQEAYGRKRQQRAEEIRQWDQYLDRLRSNLSKVLDLLDNMSIITPEPSTNEGPESPPSEIKEDTSASGQDLPTRSLKLQYLEGKICGTAVYDEDGALIIAAREAVTRAVLERAEAANRMGALIANLLDKE